MTRWETKRAFIKWMEEKRDEAKKNVNGFDVGAGIIDLNTKNSIVCIEHIENMIDDNMIEHFNAHFEETDIDIHYLEEFIKTVEEVRFFKKSKLSSDATEFKREIGELKKKADYLQHFSDDNITIRLPSLPHYAILSKMDYFKEEKINEDIIRAFHEFFKDRKRLPKTTKLYKERVKEFHETSNTLGADNAVRTMRYYKAKKN